MSAPDTNIDKQNKRHKPSLLGIRGAMIFGALMLIAVVFYALLSDGDKGATAYDASEGVAVEGTEAPAAGAVEGTVAEPATGTVAEPATSATGN